MKSNENEQKLKKVKQPNVTKKKKKVSEYFERHTMPRKL